MAWAILLQYEKLLNLLELANGIRNYFQIEKKPQISSPSPDRPFSYPKLHIFSFITQQNARSNPHPTHINILSSPWTCGTNRIAISVSRLFYNRPVVFLSVVFQYTRLRANVLFIITVFKRRPRLRSLFVSIDRPTERHYVPSLSPMACQYPRERTSGTKASCPSGGRDPVFSVHIFICPKPSFFSVHMQWRLEHWEGIKIDEKLVCVSGREIFLINFTVTEFTRIWAFQVEAKPFYEKFQIRI